jgi:predicted PurR-regulated permease PerM
MSRTVRLNPLWVLLAILVGVELGAIVGSTFGGLVGALLAVPAASAIQVIARDLWAEHRSAQSAGELVADEVATAVPAAPSGTSKPA